MPKKLSLKPVEKELKQILAKLKIEAGKPKLTKKQKKLLTTEIKKLKKFISQIPPVCHGRYDMGI